MKRPRPVVALYPGSFDPITRGHEDIVRRGLRVADTIFVAVAHTSTHTKQGLFSVEERVALIKGVFADEERIEAVSFSGLLVDFAKERGAHLVIRGLRAVSDFEYELQMAQMNQELWGEVETIFLVPEVQNSFISSSLVREVAKLGGDVSSFVSPSVFEQLRLKLAE
ncbi:MAG: pantetheine-phosphate adenylyltransferase [Gemmatimonadota bacterium]|nr:pantetheine-phosphate adenylyltransferase [Gemmatimonadota bacterium]